MTGWKPPKIENRQDGFRCLAFHRGAWHDVVWVARFNSWMFGYGSPMITDGNREFAPLPPLPKDAPDFWKNDWKLKW